MYLLRALVWRNLNTFSDRVFGDRRSKIGASRMPLFSAFDTFLELVWLYCTITPWYESVAGITHYYDYIARNTLQYDCVTGIQLSMILLRVLQLSMILLRILNLCGFGSLEVACLPLVPKFAGWNPPEAVGFLGRKKSSARLPSEGK